MKIYCGTRYVGCRSLAGRTHLHPNRRLSVRKRPTSECRLTNTDQKKNCQWDHRCCQYWHTYTWNTSKKWHWDLYRLNHHYNLDWLMINSFTDLIRRTFEHNWIMWIQTVYTVHCGGARGVMVIVVGIGHGDTSSNPGRDWMHFTLH